jgi:class 3 adenylate cyclase
MPVKNAATMPRSVSRGRYDHAQPTSLGRETLVRQRADREAGLAAVGYRAIVRRVAELPRGTVTILFTDVEGSTRLLQRLGTDAYREQLELHRELLRAAFARHGGREVEMQGDSFHVAFPRASDAVVAAGELQGAGLRVVDETLSGFPLGKKSWSTRRARLPSRS